MFEQLNTLAHTLERMFTLYERVLELMEVERNSLAKMNFESLYSELREKDEVLAIIRRLDKERLKIQDHFAMINGINPAEVTLKYMGDHLVSEGAQSASLGLRLLAVRDRIQDVVSRIQDKIQINEVFIEKSVNNIRGLAEIYSQAFSDEKPANKNHQTYGKKAIVQKAPGVPGKLLEKRL